MKNISSNILSLLLLIGLTFHFGRLFEIFAWNSSITRIESISRKSFSDQSTTCQYSKLIDQYWEERALEESKIRIDFSERYSYLNHEAEAELGKNLDKYLSYKPVIIKRFLFRVIYPDCTGSERSL